MICFNQALTGLAIILYRVMGTSGVDCWLLFGGLLVCVPGCISGLERQEQAKDENEML